VAVLFCCTGIRSSDDPILYQALEASVLSGGWIHCGSDIDITFPAQARAMSGVHFNHIHIDDAWNLHSQHENHFG